mmetsp:Transcript_10912/g.16485  ORF Transcript_10912/g.16485 Transcript_10912/m.16485 type:complete len:124 (-) Transcript_10912:13-384(-)
MVIVTRSDLPLSRGKLCAQCSHGAVDAIMRSGTAADDPEINKQHLENVHQWFIQGQTKIVVKVETQEELKAIYEKAKKANHNCTMVRDAGRTEIESGTITVVCIGPSTISSINEITGHLSLLK